MTVRNQIELELGIGLTPSASSSKLRAAFSSRLRTVVTMNDDFRNHTIIERWDRKPDTWPESTLSQHRRWQNKSVILPGLGAKLNGIFSINPTLNRMASNFDILLGDLNCTGCNLDLVLNDINMVTNSVTGCST